MDQTHVVQGDGVVDLVIPARDEQANIGPLFEALPLPYFRHVIVADNGSIDRTAELAAACGGVVVSEGTPGYGGACLAALAWIEGLADPPDLVAFVDADLSDDPAQLPLLSAPIKANTADLVIGSRTCQAEPGALSVAQCFGNLLACTLIRLLAKGRYTDLGPMRVVRYESLKRLNMTDRTWGWTVEMQYKAAVLGLRTVEINVPYRQRRAGRSKISGSIIGSIRAGRTIILTILRLCWQHKDIVARAP